MIEISITNFQSIAKSTLTVEGFTALSGRSNIGKSAIIRAIKCALTNAKGTHFVRHGDTCLRRVKGVKTCKCQATVQIVSPGFELLWEKGDAVNRTTLNGVVYDKPEDAKFLVPHKLEAVSVGSDKEFLQVSDQFDGPFLMRTSGPAIAELVADVGQLAVINDAVRLADRDRKEAVALRRLREKDVGDLAGQLEAFRGLDGEVSKVDDLEALQARTLTIETKIRELNLLIERIARVGAVIQTLTGIDKVEVPTLDDLRTSATNLIAVYRWAASFGVKLQVVESLDGVETLRAPSTSEAEASVEKLRCIDAWVRKLRVTKEIFSLLAPVENIPIPEIPEVLSVDAVATLNRWDRQVTALTKQIEVGEAEIDLLTKEEAGLDEAANSLGVCPTCVQPMASALHRHPEVA